MLRPIFFILSLFLLIVFAAHAQPGYTIEKNPTEISSNPIPENLLSLILFIESKGLEIRPLLDDPRFELYDNITGRFTNAAEIRFTDLNEYKKRIRYDDKLDRISGFIREYEPFFAKAEVEYGISRFVIAAIIGVESDFGRVIGRFNPFNAYVSMYNENYRAPFARAQLEELLIFTKKNKMDVFEMKSSYAGAVSYAQFIPYSLNRWFVGNELYNMENNIYSVANYLAHFKKSSGTIEGAVFRYNPSRMYTDTVLDLAKGAEALFTKKN